MRLEVVDEVRYAILSGLHLSSAYRFSGHDVTTWYIVVDDPDLYIIVQYKRGILTMGVGQTEDESKDSVSIVGKTSNSEVLGGLLECYRMPITFKDVMEFMNWTCKDYWDD